jgi:hypothetical protein
MDPSNSHFIFGMLALRLKYHQTTKASYNKAKCLTTNQGHYDRCSEHPQKARDDIRNESGGKIVPAPRLEPPVQPTQDKQSGHAE